MGEEVYIHHENISTVLSFEMPKSATVFNHLRKRFGPASFYNKQSPYGCTEEIGLWFYRENTANQKEIYYDLELSYEEVDMGIKGADMCEEVRPALIYSNYGKVPNKFLKWIIDDKLVVRDGSIITDLLSEGLRGNGTEGIVVGGVGKIRVDGNELGGKTERIYLEYQFWDGSLQGVTYHKNHYPNEETKNRNMQEYSKLFRVLFPKYSGILSPKKLAGWKGLNQNFEEEYIFTLDQELNQKEAIDEITDVLFIKLWTEFQEAAALLKAESR